MTWLLSLLSGGLFNAIFGLFSSWITVRSNEQINATDNAASVVNTETQAQATVTTTAYNHWWSTAPIVAFALPGLLYYGKCVIWDTMLGMGSTPALHGDIADLMKYSMMSLTGYGGAVGSTAIIASALRR